MGGDFNVGIGRQEMKKSRDCGRKSGNSTKCTSGTMSRLLNSIYKGIEPFSFFCLFLQFEALISSLKGF